jgi:hypothetical protein
VNEANAEIGRAVGYFADSGAAEHQDVTKPRKFDVNRDIFWSHGIELSVFIRNGSA